MTARHRIAAVVTMTVVLLATGLGRAAPTSIHCVIIADASSAWWAQKKVWAGEPPIERERYALFDVREHPEKELGAIREVLFSRLDSTRPVIRFYFVADANKLVGGVEVNATVLARYATSLVIAFPFAPKEWYASAISFEHGKTVITRVSSGHEGIGGSVAIAECK